METMIIFFGYCAIFGIPALITLKIQETKKTKEMKKKVYFCRNFK